LGARVIKIERPEVGDLCRTLYISDTDLEGDSTLFHAINRNKESFSANLKDPKDLELVKKLIAKADIITQNFRPGVIEKIGLDYESVKKINPQIVYGSISGYGSDGPWKDLPWSRFISTIEELALYG
jgi:crotonobetainyl-CoA:carnitine CoA-transferase CaiB-like acyl-CoA transferase